MALPNRWINVTDPGWTVGPRDASCDRLIHIILPDRGADDRMDLWRSGPGTRPSNTAREQAPTRPIGASAPRG